MKAKSILNWKVALVLAALPFVGAWLQGEPTDPTTASTGDGVTVSSATASDTPAATPTTTAKPALATAPADLKLYGGTAEVVKMAQAGIGDEVILAYVTNSNVRFGVNADQIVYLNDLGVSGSVVTAMMQHDSTMSTTTAPTTPPPATMPPATAPGTDYSTQIANDNTVPPPDYTDYNTQNPGDYLTADDTGYFYDSLQPYGNWINLTGYGMCWQPTVCVRDASWRPYCDRGRWLYSDCGWYWQSDYSWGWAAFHYGRWFCDSGRGWVWRPNRVWGPAWVAWRQSGEYCGWAPLPPAAAFVPGIGFRFHNQSVSAGFGFELPARLFAFIPTERFVDYAPGRYVASGAQAARIFHDSSALDGVAVENGHVSNHGLDPRIVDERAGEHVRRVVIQKETGTDAGGHIQPDHLGKRGDSLVIYRPQLPATPMRHPTTVSAGVTPPARPSGNVTTGNSMGNVSPANNIATAGATTTRTPTVIKQGLSPTQSATGTEAASHLHVYQVTHGQPQPAVSSSPGTATPPARPNAGTYPPNSMVVIGQKNLTQPEWSSRPGPSSTGTPGYTYTYRPGYAPTYAVTDPSGRGNPQGTDTGSTRNSHGGPSQYNGFVGDRSQGTDNGRNTGNWSGTSGSSGNSYNRSSSYTPSAPQSSYRTAEVTPRESYSAPQRPSYSAPAPSYSPPSRPSYSAPTPAPSSGSSGSSSSHSSSSGSSSSSSSSSGSNSRGR